MSLKKLGMLLLLITAFCSSIAQTDSALQTLEKFPKKYFDVTEKKVNQYTERITGKTEKTLTKLSRWENKIKTLLQKVNSEAADRLFAPGQMSFSQALEEYRKGQTVVAGYKAGYDKYRDDLTTQLKYLEEKKELLDKRYMEPLKKSKAVISKMEADVQQTEAMKQFIKERKKQLLEEAMKHLGNNKYLQKINKESFYYTETLRNYKEIFNDSKKAEETALTILNKIPAFQKFMRENGMLASLFGPPGGSVPPSGGGGGSLAGLQTRASVNSLIQNRISAGGPNAMQTVQQNLQQAQAELSKLKDQILKAGGNSAGGETPPPGVGVLNMQKTKTFLQRLEYGMNFQPEKNNNIIPGALNVGLSVGYKLNGKSVVGLGLNYKLGVGRIEKIRFSHQGIGLRTFMDWKIKKQFFVSGGYELNHLASFKNIAALQDADAWQQSALLGISKKIVMKSKFIKGGKLQLLYDFLWKEQVPVSKQWVVRVGYNL